MHVPLNVNIWKGIQRVPSNMIRTFIAPAVTYGPKGG